MATINIYFYVEDLGLTVAQRNTIVSNLQTWGNRNSDTNPKNKNHWRIRTDNKSALYELWVDNSQLTPTFFQNALATIFGVNANTITYAVKTSPFGQYVDFNYNSLPKLRLGVFGGVNASYVESQIACNAFLVANNAVWNAEV